MDIRKLALKLLTEYEVSGKYVNLSLSSHSADGLSAEERGMLTALLYTTVEHKITYDYYIGALSGRSLDKIDPHTRDVLRLGLCQILDMDRIPDFAAVNETVKLCRNKGESAFVNAILRSCVKSKESLPLPDKAKNAARHYSVRYSLPISTVRHFIGLVGEEEAEELFKCFNKTAPITLTVNLNKTTPEELCARINEFGISASVSPISKISVVLSESCNPRSLPGFDEGHFFVQDAASAICAAALGVAPGESACDLCAAPGGKSFAMASLSYGKAKISAFDIHESKLSLITDGASRLGFENLSVAVNDAAVRNEALIGGFDKVLCDVPCSGLGVIGKKPDLRYKSGEAAKSLPPLQMKILNTAKDYLKPNGVLVYSTCTLNPEENQDVITEFLSKNPNFVLDGFVVGETQCPSGMLTLYPHRHGTDGFFIARLKRVG